MAENANKREYVEQKIKETDAGVYAYDKALVEDLRARFSSSPAGSQVNKNVQIGPTSQMFNIIGSLDDDNIIMPFISLERLDWQLNLDRQGFQTFVGDEVYTRLDNQNTPVEVRAQAIPITINYRLCVWSKDRITNDALCREILFYYHLRPSLMVYVGHGINMAHKFNIYFNSGIEDNSDIANHSIGGTYFRQDMTLYTDDAYLWRANWQNKVSITPDLTFNYGVNTENMQVSYSDSEDLNL
jgi:hypothetical protein